MRILLFSDIHGNATALEAVLADSQRHGPYDLMLCAGDLAWAGPRPAEVLGQLRALCKNDPSGATAPAACVLGNCDAFLWSEPPAGKEAERFSRHQAWMRQQLSADDLAFMQAMPRRYRLSPLPGHDLLLVHANPHNLDDPITPQLNDAGLAALIGDAEFEVLAFGHVHLPAVRLWRGRLLLNVASVGLPMDGDARAAYSVLTWAREGWTVTCHRVAYDVEAVARDMRSGGLPRGKHFAARLLAARYT
ncbi:MAG: metallophosphoesterase family protein [Caldilineales bacterium]